MLNFFQVYICFFRLESTLTKQSTNFFLERVCIRQKHQVPKSPTKLTNHILSESDRRLSRFLVLLNKSIRSERAFNLIKKQKLKIRLSRLFLNQVFLG